MKRLTFSAVLLLTILITKSQNYGNIWQFSDSKGLDFNSCEPAVITGSNTGFEGCSTISNSSGQLLFYTNSDKVWDNTHSIMSNGNLIPASGTISQVLTIPKPLSSTIYYVITTKIQATGTLTLQFHVVDMTLNAGIGAVSSKNNSMSTLNITEQVCATYHGNGTDIWIVVHEYGTNSFLAFLVTSNGISSSPVISNVGPAHNACNSNINARGEIKFSPNGNKLAFNANGIGGNDASNILCLFDFNKNNGVVSNPINLPFSRGEFGLSFSPDNSKLYGTTWKSTFFPLSDYNYLYQFDLSSNIPSTIISSKQIIDSMIVPNTFGTLKIAPNGKIYVRYVNSSFLGVINSPNQGGVSCNYIKNGLFIGSQAHHYGLNNYIEYTNYCSTTKINEASYQSHLKFLYPNPSQDKIVFNLPDKNSHYCITLTNIQGSIIKVITANDVDKVNIESSDLDNGIYYYVIQQDNRTIERGKLVVE